MNEKLSQERAVAVKKELVSDGLADQAISTQGFGPSFPIAANTSSIGRRENRRVEIEVTVDESKLPKKKG